MKKNTIKLTRKIQVVIDLPTMEERKEAIGKLYAWQDRAYRTANIMVSHLYVQEMLKEFFYLSEGIQYKLAREQKDEAGILQTSRMNTIYQVTSKRFKGEMPTNIISCLKASLYSTFKKNQEAYWRGDCTLMNFKKDMPFPFTTEGMSKLEYDADKKAFCFRLFKIPLKTYLGRDHSDKWRLLQRVSQGELKLCTSHLQLKDGKTFWLAVFELEKESHHLNPGVIAEVSLSLEYPIVVKVGKNRHQIGNKEEFLHRRLAIQAARKRAQVGATYNKSGKGKKRKLKAVDRFRQKEKNYILQRLHVYSRRLIDFCIQHQAGTLMLMNQEDKIGIAKEEGFVLRNWSYCELMTKIQYKAKKVGIEVIVG
jgi:transposase